MIAVDAMGGDGAPSVAVEGAYRAAQRNVPVALFGDGRQIENLLYSLDSQWRSLPIIVEHCTQRIMMGEIPTKSVSEKTDSSLVRAMKAVAEGRADAVVSAGNSGAALVSAIVHLQRVPGVLRPAIGRFLPTKNSHVFCLDLGANTDTRAEHLVQFAHMGHCFVKISHNIESPRIALLSNGHERYKGSKSAKDAYVLLERADLQFVGNIEPRHFFEHHADVIVSDGFVGNIMLKTMESTARSVTHMLAAAYKKSLMGRLLGFINRSVVKRLVAYSDYNKKEGALLLGVSKPCVIAHGSSNSSALENSILFAHNTVMRDIIPSFNRALTQRLESISANLSDRTGNQAQT